MHAVTLPERNPAPAPRAKRLGRTIRELPPAPATPTRTQFGAFESMFRYFNAELFGGELPPVLLNFSRLRHTYGFFAPRRWEKGKTRRHEISINPSMLKSRKPIETASTLVHEMCHLWQWENGKPGRRGYHNREWASKMTEVGLVPSSTGAPGGLEIGERVSHYVDLGGRFAKAFRTMPREWKLPWLCEEPGPDSSRNKIGYVCPSCRARVWGKPGLLVLCEEDGSLFVVNRRRRRAA